MERTASSKLKRVVRRSLVTVAIGCAGAASAQQGSAAPLAAPAATAVTDRLDTNRQAQHMLGVCPASAFQPARVGTGPRITVEALSEAQCAADPVLCHDACVTGSGAACFRLARAFQQNEEAVPPRYAQMLFAMACGFGDAAGCTNRGANIRNRSWAGNPFGHVSEQAKNACQFRTFSLACRQNDPWGCAMLGQSYQHGEGVARSAPLARAAFRRSCRLSPDFDACEFSREGIEALAVRR